MAYYQVIGNNQGYVSDPGFMQNVVALGNAMGKNLNSKVFQDAANQNGLIPEIEDDQQNGVKINYKSPQLVGRGYYSAGAPGNPNGAPKAVKPAKPESLSKTIQDMLAGQAINNAKNETAQYGPELGGSVGLPEGAKQNPDGTITDATGNEVGEASPDQQFPQAIGADPTKVFMSALQKQAQDPAMAKAMGMPQPKTAATHKETLDTAIADAQAGNRTWADLYRQYPTKIKAIQQARTMASNLDASGMKDTGKPADTTSAQPSASKHKAGDTAVVGGVKYTRNDQGQWLPQQS